MYKRPPLPLGAYLNNGRPHTTPPFVPLPNDKTAENGCTCTVNYGMTKTMHIWGKSCMSYMSSPKNIQSVCLSVIRHLDVPIAIGSFGTVLLSRETA